MKQSCLNDPIPQKFGDPFTADLYRDVVPGGGEGDVVAEAGGPLQQLPPLAAPRHHLDLVLLVDHHPAPHSLFIRLTAMFDKFHSEAANTAFSDFSYFYNSWKAATTSLFSWIFAT